MSSLTNRIYHLLGNIWGNRCAICDEFLGAEEEDICVPCATSLPRMEISDIHDNVVLRMLWDKVPVVSGGSWLHYRPGRPAHQLLMKIKYKGHMDLAAILGKWAAKEIAVLGLQKEVEVLIPVPMSKEKKRKRGYNQAEEIARGMAKEWDLALETKLLTREGGHVSQTRLGAEERALNVQHIYHAHIPQNLMGRHYLLVDDILTTGSTLAACTQAILLADPTAKVSVFTLAKS